MSGLLQKHDLFITKWSILVWVLHMAYVSFFESYISSSLYDLSSVTYLLKWKRTINPNADCALRKFKMSLRNFTGSNEYEYDYNFDI